MEKDQAIINEWKRSKAIGIIGLGDMGRLYALRFAKAGWQVNACDMESQYSKNMEEYQGTAVNILKNGHYVSRASDYIIYSVDAESISKIVSIYGPSTKMGAIVGGQTSCKAPEIAAFEAFLPKDVEIITCHSLHGPKVNPVGQPLVLINHRGTKESFRFVETLFTCLESKHVYLTAEQHDRITADTQAVTHAAFLSMGVAWKANNQFPWEIPRWIGGIENAKINISLRIFSNKWHVYAGLAITNPAAHKQILQYASSSTELFKLMISEKEEELRTRLYAAKKFIFGNLDPSHSLLLSDDLLDKFSLGNVPPEGHTPNSHLSLLAVVDSWYQLGIVPYDHMICSTPLFRIWLGVTEYLFCTPGLLEECIKTAVTDRSFRPDDLEFTLAARMWSKIVSFGDFDLYRKEFETTQIYFSEKFPEATRIGNEMIKTILEKTN
ncbi:prephenate dehydrogenase [Nadsonia fulvescens var. elongata DSM 6958]|uniref:Prephenate dehydrogenase [NADP(+)] n=1 Tax=Nadsonia fulvescens var. elongata DSM 6958 TaxID=857566 RepID=A0A1E3PHM1_9ASCO|nr:prephenate dehydrogenase [Nadsonia fulvescens var. elongata DSM 6958]